MQENKKDIYVTKAFLPPKEEFFEKIAPLWDTHILTNMGPLHNEFERKLASFLEVPHCLAFCNGHSALEMAIQAMELTGEVITTPFTFASTTHAIVRNHLTPVFCDIKDSNYTMNPQLIESLITENTSAILPVHVYGQVCDVEVIQEIADKHNLKVIYDAAHAFGVKYRGVGIGNYGDVSAFSFHATKPFNSIEGGAVVVREVQYGLSVYQLKNFGFMDEDMVCSVGGNAKLSELHAAMGLCNLQYFEEITENRKKVVEQYYNRLGETEGIKLLDKQENVDENYAYFPVLFDEKVFGEGREQVYSRLKKNRVHARRYFYPLTKDFLCYKGMFASAQTPVAERVANEVLTLPLYDSLSLEEVNLICDIILESH